MREFDPSQPSNLHDSLNNKMIPWTGEQAVSWGGARWMIGKWVGTRSTLGRSSLPAKRRIRAGGDFRVVRSIDEAKALGF